MDARPRGSLFRPDATARHYPLCPACTCHRRHADRGGWHWCSPTQGRRLSKYWLTGPQAGAVTTLVEPARLSRLISTGADGRVWVALVSPVNAGRGVAGPARAGIAQPLWKLPDRVSCRSSPRCGRRIRSDSGEAIAGLHSKHLWFSHGHRPRRKRRKLWMGCMGARVAYCAIPPRSDYDTRLAGKASITPDIAPPTKSHL